MWYRKNQGFTLVELLVVVAILALLVSLVIPRTQAAMDSSRQAKVDADLDTIEEALERHFTDLGYYPFKLKELLDEGYLKGNVRQFKSPVSGFWYFYAVDNNRNDEHPRAQAYILGAPGRDSKRENPLHRSGPLPQGKDPNNRAWAWAENTGLTLLTLYAEDDTTPIDETITPTTHMTYRTSCQPSSTVHCDLRTN